MEITFLLYTALGKNAADNDLLRFKACNRFVALVKPSVNHISVQRPLRRWLHQLTSVH